MQLRLDTPIWLICRLLASIGTHTRTPLEFVCSHPSFAAHSLQTFISLCIIISVSTLVSMHAYGSLLYSIFFATVPPRSAKPASQFEDGFLSVNCVRVLSIKRTIVCTVCTLFFHVREMKKNKE